jgi:hypothetical protein
LEEADSFQLESHDIASDVFLLAGMVSSKRDDLKWRLHLPPEESESLHNPLKDL